MTNEITIKVPMRLTSENCMPYIVINNNYKQQ